jgi:hypothetical protein
MAVAGWCSKASEDGSDEVYGYVATAAVFFFTFFFGATWVLFYFPSLITKRD